MVVFQDAIAEEGALPQVRACAGSTARTTSPRWRRSSRAGSRGSRDRRPRTSTTRASRRRRTSSSSTAARVSSRRRSRRCRRYDLPRVAVISLAKRIEEVFVPGRPDPILLDPHRAGLQLLQRIRDEAHRFALGFHRQRRDGAGARVDLRHARGRRPGAPAGAAAATSARPSGVLAASAGGARGRARASRRRRRARSTRSCTGPAARARAAPELHLDELRLAAVRRVRVDADGGEAGPLVDRDRPRLNVATRGRSASARNGRAWRSPASRKRRRDPAGQSG